jgi:hypothetical protein
MVKLRSGPPSDADSPDSALSLWAGELPLINTWGEPVTDPELARDHAVPAHITARARSRAFVDES